MGSSFELTDKTFLVTGATSGIGYTICEKIIEMNGGFIGIGRNLSSLLNRFPDSKNRLIQFDLMNLGEIDQMISNIGIIDGFVHSAGIVELNLIKFFKPDVYERIRKTNLDSVLYILNSLIRHKKLKAGSSIVLISSISGMFGMKGNGLYGITKAAVNSLAQTYANELSNQRIRVNTVAPGMVKTQITLNSINTLGEEQIKEDEKKYPLGYGEPEDVANPVIFLLSDASKWITGQTLVVDGGRTAVI